MSALNEYVASLAGRYAVPATSDPDLANLGRCKILRGELVDQVLWVVLETPGGERRVKAHECVITRGE